MIFRTTSATSELAENVEKCTVFQIVKNGARLVDGKKHAVGFLPKMV